MTERIYQAPYGVEIKADLSEASETIWWRSKEWPEWDATAFQTASFRHNEIKMIDGVTDWLGSQGS